MSVLVATSDGYHIFTSSGEHLAALEGHAVDGLASGPEATWVAIVDRREVWQHTADGEWRTLAAADVDLSSVVTVSGVVFAGTYDARLLRLDGDVLVPVEAFDHISNRDEWHQVGPALNVRSMSVTCDEQVFLANVHVGGIQRSTDGGRSWAPTLPVDHDVHEVRAHPTMPEVVMAAAAVGLCVSTDAGATWSVVTDGLPMTYARAVNFIDDDVLLSISDGPRATRAAIFRRPVAGGSLERVDAGLGDHLTGNVDTRCLATGKGRAALADGAGNVWLSQHGVVGWERLADGLPFVSGVAIA
ncbi:MAG TPA: hypothetical protein VEP49_11020 [Acidimicrobiia bacterium]|nr:hypothetical protein [Acidimicrobiia bacterium]